MWLIYILIGILSLGCGFVIGYFLSKYIRKLKVKAAEEDAKKILEDAKKEVETKKKELLLETKDQLIKERNLFEKETRERRIELQKLERHIFQKEENIDKRADALERKERKLAKREDGIVQKETELNSAWENYQKELEKISGITSEEAKNILINDMVRDAEIESQKYINKIESEAKITAERKAKKIIVSAIQRTASDVSAEISVSSVSLPNDEMKGRIIGREGRNIRALETLTGVDIIIDDTPEAIVISCFDPIRREIAKISIEKLISDGRIHPARIEEVIEKVTKDINDVIQEEGEKACFDLGIGGMAAELQKYIGRLKFRTSYGQNVLSHSIEVAHIAGILASEVGANTDHCRRAGLLHDIGKGVTTEGEGGHATVGAEIARKFSENPNIVNAIGSHHLDWEPESLEAIIVQTADAISASRPGARKESFENYIKRLESLEKIANDFEGVDKSFAIQAGRELRIFVNNDSIGDDNTKKVAKDVAKKIEEELKFPGQIKVIVIRETRVIEYAK